MIKRCEAPFAHIQPPRLHAGCHSAARVLAIGRTRGRRRGSSPTCRCAAVAKGQRCERAPLRTRPSIAASADPASGLDHSVNALGTSAGRSRRRGGRRRVRRSTASPRIRRRFEYDVPQDVFKAKRLADELRRAAAEARVPSPLAAMPTMPFRPPPRMPPTSGTSSAPRSSTRARASCRRLIEVRAATCHCAVVKLPDADTLWHGRRTVEATPRASSASVA